MAAVQDSATMATGIPTNTTTPAFSGVMPKAGAKNEATTAPTTMSTTITAVRISSLRGKAALLAGVLA